MNKFGEAIEDCDLAILNDEHYVKGYIRKAQAHVGLGDRDSLEESIRSYAKAKEIAEKTNETDILREVESGLTNARALLKKAKTKDYYKILEVCIYTHIYVYSYAYIS